MAYIDNFTEQELREMVNNSISFRELSRKIGYASLGDNEKTIKKRLNEYNISTDHFTGLPKSYVKRTEENTFIKNSSATQKVLRDMYKKGNYTPYKCSICGMEPIWNNKPLSLTLDHINGDNKDDRLENLRWVCPNCDRQLDTFGSKNPNKKIGYNHKKSSHRVD